ncbi:MAG: hypothetical protein WC224_05345 [Sphaerochaetaceae bacterium]
MAAYYYLIASLPMLKFNETPLINQTTFLKACHQELHPKDYALVASLFSAEVSTKHPYLKEWQAFNAEVTATLAEGRAQRLNFIYTPQKIYPRNLNLERSLKEILQHTSPLEAELMLMRLYWEKATQLSRMKIFTVEVLFTYAIHLKILERKALFTTEEGNREFNKLFSDLQTIIKSI